MNKPLFGVTEKSRFSSAAGAREIPGQNGRGTIESLSTPKLKSKSIFSELVGKLEFEFWRRISGTADDVVTVRLTPYVFPISKS